MQVDRCGEDVPALERKKSHKDCEKIATSDLPVSAEASVTMVHACTGCSSSPVVLEATTPESCDNDGPSSPTSTSAATDTMLSVITSTSDVVDLTCLSLSAFKIQKDLSKIYLLNQL